VSLDLLASLKYLLYHPFGELIFSDFYLLHNTYPFHLQVLLPPSPIVFLICFMTLIRFAYKYSCFLPPPSSSCSQLHQGHRLDWLGVSQPRWTLVFNVYRLLTLASVTSSPDRYWLCSTCNPWIWAPFGFLRSPNCAQFLSRIFGSAGFIEISILPSLRWADFFFFICCIILIRFTYKYSCLLPPPSSSSAA